jgi:hypothetical protein
MMLQAWIRAKLKPLSTAINESSENNPPAITNEIISLVIPSNPLASLVNWDKRASAYNKVTFRRQGKLFITRHYRPRTFRHENANALQRVQFQVEYDIKTMRALAQPYLYYYVPADAAYMTKSDKPIKE